MQHARTTLTASLPVLLATLLTGCAGDDMMAMPTSRTAPAHGTAGATPPGPADPTGQSNALVVTGKQRSYLDALGAAGVEPSSELRALSIGSYVCQARAAKQTDHAVWDFVLPLVRDDLQDEVDGGEQAPSTADLRTTTADYIRIATERLC